MANTGLNINSLNDDCLVNIFDYLPFIQKFKIDAVCKKWQRLNELSWKNVRQLCVWKSSNSNFYINVIKKCGKYIKNLHLIIYEDYLEIFEEISKNCVNINHFGIHHVIQKDGERLYTDFHLGIMFKKNPKINSISLQKLKLNGYCFLGLNLDLITELTILNCKFENSNHSYFFSQFTNLRKIFLASFHSYYDINRVILALNNSNCENIQEIKLNIRHEVVESDKLLMFLSKQKKLLKLDFKCLSVKVNRHFFQNLSLDNIVDLEIHFDEDAVYFSKEFNNLENLDCKIENLTEQFLDNLSIKCKNLKRIKIKSEEKYSLTVNCENYFSRLKNLESFKYDSSCKTASKNYDIILKSLRQCQNLKVLSLSICEITSNCAANISALLSLTDLHFHDSEITESQLTFIITKLVNLRKLTLILCKNINSHFIFEFINELKRLRQDENILEITFDRTKDFTLDVLPLLKFKTCSCIINF